MKRTKSKYSQKPPQPSLITLGLVACLGVALIPYLVSQQFEPLSLAAIPFNFLLIAQLCPILLCVIVYFTSRAQAKRDLLTDEET